MCLTPDSQAKPVGKPSKGCCLEFGTVLDRAADQPCNRATLTELSSFSPAGSVLPLRTGQDSQDPCGKAFVYKETDLVHHAGQLPE